MRGLMSMSASRSPLTDTSICSPRVGAAVELPGRDRCAASSGSVYSPSAGKLCTTEMPPRVPIGAPSTCRELRRGARHLVDRARSGAASGSPSASRLTLRGRAQVALEHRRRHRLHVGDVVEVVADGVGRQERGDVDVDAEHVANRRGILGAIQALERDDGRDWA